MTMKQIFKKFLNIWKKKEKEKYREMDPLNEEEAEHWEKRNGFTACWWRGKAVVGWCEVREMKAGQGRGEEGG